MTLLILIVWGFGSVLIISSIETDKATGRSVSIRTAISQIWNNELNFGQPQVSQAGDMGKPFTPPGSAPVPYGTPISQSPKPAGGINWVNAAGTVVGGAAGPSGQYDAYRAGIVRAYLQSQT